MAHRAKIAVTGPRVSPKVARGAVTLKLGVMMKPRFDAENLLQGVLGQALLAAH